MSSPVSPAPDAMQRISAPAIGLLVTGIIGAIIAVLSLLMNVLGVGMGSLGGGQQMPEEYMQLMSGGLGVFSALIGVAVAAFIIYASLQMKKCTQWGMSLAASIVAMIPCISPCCIIGLPIGIWCIVILVKPEIKSAFR